MWASYLRPMDKFERNTFIVEEHLRGTNLSKIGRELGVTRERIRQIVRNAGVPVDLSAALRRLSCCRVIRCVICRRPRFVESLRGAAPLTCGRDSCIRTAKRTPEKYDREELVQHLQDLAASLGHTPGQKDISQVSPPDHTIYYRYFGSLRAAQEAAGLKPNQRGGGRGPEPL